MMSASASGGSVMLTIAAGAAAAGVLVAAATTLCAAAAVVPPEPEPEPDEQPELERQSWPVWRSKPPKGGGGELWRTSSFAGASLAEIMDCEPEPIQAGHAAADPDNFWSSAAHRAELLARAPKCNPLVSDDGLVRFELDGRPLTQRGFLRLFAEEEGQVARLVPGGDVCTTREAWATTVAAARAFRLAVLQSCGDGSGGVYWKGPGFAMSALDDEFIALCCGTVAPLCDRGDGSKFSVNPGTVRATTAPC
jgi:hypothetical protein